MKGSDIESFSVKLHQRLTQNLNLSKFKSSSSKNLVILRNLFLTKPALAIQEINSVRQSDAIGTNSFFSNSINEDIFQLGAIQNVKDKSASISKIVPFSIQVRKK